MFCICVGIRLARSCIGLVGVNSTPCRIQDSPDHYNHIDRHPSFPYFATYGTLNVNRSAQLCLYPTLYSFHKEIVYFRSNSNVQFFESSFFFSVVDFIIDVHIQFLGAPPFHAGNFFFALSAENNDLKRFNDCACNFRTGDVKTSTLLNASIEREKIIKFNSENYYHILRRHD